MARLAGWLRRQGWREISRADAALREHGIDLVVKKDGRTKVIEVKGWPSAQHASGARAGQPKRWRQTIARSYFGDLMLTALLLRADHPHAEVAIAVPDRTTHTALLKRVQASLSVLGIGAYLIDADGDVVGVSAQ